MKEDIARLAVKKGRRNIFGDTDFWFWEENYEYTYDLGGEVIERKMFKIQ